MLFKGNISTYFLISILVLISALLYIFRDDFLKQMENNYLGAKQDITISEGEKVDIDLEILSDSRLSQMKTNVPYFDFNSYGRKVPSGIDISNIPIFDPVHLGNNRPLK